MDIKVFWKKGVCDLDIEDYTGFKSYEIKDNILHLVGNPYDQFILLDNVSEFQIEKVDNNLKDIDRLL